MWGAGPTKTGVRRLASGDEDKMVRDWFVNEVNLLGCEVKIDALVTSLPYNPGKDDLKPPTGMGSHLDIQPSDGRYHGMYGVLSGLDGLRTFKKNYTPSFSELH